MAEVCVLGGGLVGRFVAEHLHGRGRSVLLIDAAADAEIPSIPFKQMRVGADIADHIEGAPVVVNCLPGRIGHAVRHHLLSIDGMRLADLAFTVEDPRSLADLAAENGGVCIFDVGIAPGLSNLLLASAQQSMGPLETGSIRVGGNPLEPDDGWSYMAPFSPADVIEEYTRPARIIRNGEIVIAAPLTERHTIQVPGVGQMEAFLTDGLRSLLDTIEADELIEYTVRWPGHIDRFEALEEMDEAALLEAWRFDANRPEFTWMEVVATSRDGVELRWQVHDEGGPDGSSMARTTGLVCAAVAELLLDDPLLTPGVHPPEALASCDGVLEEILARMHAAGVRFNS